MSSLKAVEPPARRTASMIEMGVDDDNVGW
jgi:hypothetical protein